MVVSVPLSGFYLYFFSVGVSLEANICFGFQGIEDGATRQV